MKNGIVLRVGYMITNFYRGMMNPFLPQNDPLLTATAQAVPIHEISTKEIQDIIDEMYAIARGERDDSHQRVMVGLAAPQIGISKRIILVDVGVDKERKNLGELRAYINPHIIWSSLECNEGRESCYSVDFRLAGVVSRPSHIKISAYTREGELISEEFRDFTARIFQHEIDHLDGIRFPDRVGEEGVLHWIDEDRWDEYKKNWQNWPVKCPWNKWKTMKEEI